MTNSIDCLYVRIKGRLEEYEFEPTSNRADGVFYTLMWSHSYQMNCISDNDIDETIKYAYNFVRFTNNRLSRKLLKNDNILKVTEKWIYISTHNTKKEKRV